MRTPALTAALLAAFLSVGRAEEESGAGAAPPARKPYMPWSTFAALRALAPELAEARLPGTTRAGHDLWRQGQLRMPDYSLRADFDGDGVDDRALFLETGDEKGPTRYVLIYGASHDAWKRIHLQRLDDNAGAAGLRIDETTGAIGIDTGRSVRTTGAATMRVENGVVVEMTPGFVKDAPILSHLIRWDAETKRFVMEKAEPPKPRTGEDDVPREDRRGLEPPSPSLRRPEAPPTPAVAPAAPAPQRAEGSAAGSSPLDRAMAVQAKHEAAIMAIAGVVGVGIGGSEDRPALHVYVVDEAAAQRVRRAVKRVLDGVPVRIEVTGVIEAR